MSRSVCRVRSTSTRQHAGHFIYSEKRSKQDVGLREYYGQNNLVRRPCSLEKNGGSYQPIQEILAITALFSDGVWQSEVCDMRCMYCS